MILIKYTSANILNWINIKIIIYLFLKKGLQNFLEDIPIFLSYFNYSSLF